MLRIETLTCRFPRTEIGDSEATEKPMQFWMRDL